MDHVPIEDSLESLRIDSSPPRDATASAPALDEPTAPPFQVQARPRHQPLGARTGPWPVALPSAFMAPAAHDGHGGDSSHDAHVVGQGQSRYGDSAAGQQIRWEPRTRMCGQCHRMETPQWRTGPDGPGTLCNACGIRYRMSREEAWAQLASNAGEVPRP
nr:GATA transcription factor 2-like [Aegilops tauschii subsp. strangulata]